MKKILKLLTLLLISQIMHAQYLSNKFKLGSDASDIPFDLSTNSDTICYLGIQNEISGLSLSGNVTLDNDGDSYVRVILKDNNNHEYLVYESYPLMQDSLFEQFQNTAIETIRLNGIVPSLIRIEIKNATINCEKLHLSCGTRQILPNEIAECRKEQTQYIVNRLNDKLTQRNMKWRAGVTSMSEKSFEDKKNLFGENVPELFGFDYYIGGVFVVPMNNKTRIQLLERDSSNNYVSEWDWRNRHGRNWMTSVKEQLDNTCWAFSAVGALEAYINLYYNRRLKYNLSEQELRSCCTTGPNGGGDFFTALSYIRRNGLVLESCFPYVGQYVNCSNKCESPTELIHIQSRNRIYYDENIIKEKLFIAPVLFTIAPWNHQVVIAGYKTIRHGDVIYNGYSHNAVTITIKQNSSDSVYIGKTAWLIKNSWGENWGNSGYGYIIADCEEEPSCYIDGRITSMIHTDNDIICNDKDGDGYYFWGIGEKPPYCPSWVPDIPDGNDANANEGSLDAYGFLERLNPDTIPTLVISNNVEYNTRQSIYSHIRITPNGTFTVKDTINLFGRATITIENGGKLIIDGGVITNAHIVMNTGSHLKFLNNGLLVCRTDDDFYAPTGAIVEMEYGKICHSHDF